MNTEFIQNVIKTHSPLRWFGGKHFLAKHIVPLFPKHHCFVDTFGGGAHISVAKPQSPVEIFNDIDSELIHFLMTLRSQKTELLQALRSFPTSRQLYNEMLKSAAPANPVERAARWYYLLRQRIIPANGVPSGFRYGKVKNSAIDYQNSVVRLDSFEQRFRSILIESLDFREVIKRYDGPDTFFFIDSPYVDKEHFYLGGFNKKDHIDLAELLHSIQGKCLVTYYGHPLVLDLYKDFHIRTVEARVGAVVKAEQGQERRSETEFFFMNYDPDEVVRPYINFRK